MSRFKIFFSIFIFSFLLVVTSFIKNETREIEKKIFNIGKKIHSQEKDLNELQLDFSYLSSPSILEEKIEHLDNTQYFPMEHSRIFKNIFDLINLQNKLVNQKNNHEKKN